MNAGVSRATVVNPGVGRATVMNVGVGSATVVNVGAESATVVNPGFGSTTVVKASLCPEGGAGFPPWTIRPGEKGRGGEGSSTSSLLSVANLDSANGVLSSSGFPSTKVYLGRDPGGEGSCDTGTWTDVGIGVGRAKAFVTRSATTGAKIVIFMAMLCSGGG